MKKHVPAAAVISLLFIASDIFAQTNMSAGIFAGAGFFNVGESSVADYSYKTGLNIGGVFNLDLSKFVSLDAAAEFTMRGYQFNETDTAVSNNLDYISIPIHSKIKLPVLPACNAYALTGPAIGFLVSAKLDSTAPAVSSSTDVKSSFNGVDFGWDFGLGVEYAISNVTPFIEAAYYLDILDINKSPNFYTQTGNDLNIEHHSYVCEVKAGIRIAIK